ncbi:MAG: hypothetical protein AAB897_01945 [Patescibacteria group bacterium]
MIPRNGLAPLIIIVLLGAIVTAGFIGYVQFFEKNKIQQENLFVVKEAKDFTTEPAERYPTSTKTMPAEGTKIDVSGWKTYRNEEYGFEVKYPGDWKIQVGNLGIQEGEVTFGPDDETSNLSFSLHYTKNDNRSGTLLDDLRFGADTNLQAVTIGGYQGAIKDYGQGFFEAYTKTINDIGFEFSLIGSRDRLRQSKSLFDSFLSSVKFSEVTSVNPASSGHDDAKRKEIGQIMGALELYFNRYGRYPLALADVVELLSTKLQHFPEIHYGVNNDKDRYHIGITFETITHSSLPGDDFNSKGAGWTNGFDGSGSGPCAPKEVGVACFDLVVP